MATALVTNSGPLHASASRALSRCPTLIRFRAGEETLVVYTSSDPPGQTPYRIHFGNDGSN